MFEALASNDVASLECFFGGNVDPDRMVRECPRGWTHFGKLPMPALSCSIALNTHNITRYLIESGADTNKEDGAGFRPSHYAVFSGDIGVMQFLLEHGCDFSLGALNESQPIHVAAKFKSPEVIEWLLANGARVNARDCFGCTPLLVACENDDEWNVRCLIERGADPLARDKAGNTALHVALMRHRFVVARLLMAMDRISIDCANFDGITFLMIASKLGEFDLFRFLISKGANPTMVSSSGRNVLHYAVKHCHVDIVLFILETKMVDPGMHDKKVCFVFIITLHFILLLVAGLWSCFSLFMCTI